MSKARILVVGGTGRLGTLLRRVPAPEVAFLWQTRRDPGAGALCFDPALDPGRYAEAARGAAAILALAGPVRGDAQTLAVHSDLALAALAAGRAAGVPVWLASSAAVYGAAAGPSPEGRPLAPIGAYGRAKQAMERTAQAAAGGHPLTILRIGNVLGADALFGQAGPVTLDLLPDGQGPRRSWIGPQALVAVLAGLARRAPRLPPVLNVALSGTLAMEALLHAAGRPYATRSAPPGTIAEVALDVRCLAGLVRLPQRGDDAAALVADWRGALS